MKGRAIILFLTFFVACTNCARNPEPSEIDHPGQSSAIPAPEKFNTLRNRLKPFFEPMGEPDYGDWLASHDEPGQTFDQYINAAPTLPTEMRRTIYILPLGKFNEGDRKLIRGTAKFMDAFYGLPLKVLPEEDFERPLPLSNHRIHESGSRQVRSGYVLDEVLAPTLPADAAALIAFTSEDLYPDDSMNFVFGQASLENRVGVWSLMRLRDMRNHERYVSRILKVGMHETGHMFSLMHCTAYQCVMSGTNNIIETDGRPIDACPECTAKICWMTDINPAERFGKLAAEARKLGLETEAKLYEQKQSAVAASSER